MIDWTKFFWRSKLEMQWNGRLYAPLPIRVLWLSRFPFPAVKRQQEAQGWFQSDRELKGPNQQFHLRRMPIFSSWALCGTFPTWKGNDKTNKRLIKCALSNRENLVTRKWASISFSKKFPLKKQRKVNFHSCVRIISGIHFQNPKNGLKRKCGWWIPIDATLNCFFWVRSIAHARKKIETKYRTRPEVRLG